MKPVIFSRKTPISVSHRSLVYTDSQEIFISKQLPQVLQGPKSMKPTGSGPITYSFIN